MTEPGTETKASVFRWVVLLTAVATYALVILGGVVRATDSGDACPDWPRCNGELIPTFDSAVLIEFSHRMLASVVGFLVLAVAILAWRWQRGRPLIVWGAAAALVLVAGQVILGGLTVVNDLPAGLVTAHLAMAALLLATLVVLTAASFQTGVPDRTAVGVEDDGRWSSFRNLALFAALATFALMLTGSYVSGSGASLAVRDWPLFNGQLLPDGGRLTMIHAMHRIAAAGVGLLVAYVAYRAWRERHSLGFVAAAAILAFALYFAQIFVGASNVWTLLQPAAASAHLALAVAIWAMLVTVSFLAYTETQRVAARGPARPRLQTGTIQDPSLEHAGGTLPAGEAS